MPGPGSYHVVGGRPLCAGCAAAPAAPPAAQACDCCRRAVPPAEGTRLQGFWICAGCRATDEPLALSIAKSRRRLELRGLRGALPDDE